MKSSTLMISKVRKAGLPPLSYHRLSARELDPKERRAYEKKKERF